MRPDRIALYCALVLAGGGWVCESNVADRCPGANTCDIEVANVCCPYGSASWCDGSCTNDVSGCKDTPHTCVDESRVLDCSFNATIDSAECTNPVSSGNGLRWTLIVKGTLMGCGQETATFVVSPAASSDSSVDCGDWTDGVFGGCVPPSSDTSTTHYTYRQPIDGAATMPTPVTVQIERAHGSAPPLAMMTISCVQ